LLKKHGAKVRAGQAEGLSKASQRLSNLSQQWKNPAKTRGLGASAVIFSNFVSKEKLYFCRTEAISFKKI
jgi:hypothetical protein